MQRTTASLLALVLSLVACEQQPAPPKPGAGAPSSSAAAAAPGDKILARVNGAPITETDVKLRSKPPTGHTGETAKPPPDPKAVLDNLVLDEIAAQRAVELGLDKDPAYQSKLREMEASLNAFKRQELSQRFFAKEVGDKAKVSDEATKKYFDEHAREIRSEYHVMQLLFTRDEAGARAASEEIKKGASFDELAKKKFPGLPESMKPPWDLGYLKWNQIPDAWWPVIFGMKPGDVSGVIAGEESRYWVVKLVDRRELPQTSFEDMKPRIQAVLGRKQSESGRAAIVDELKKRAKVEYTP